MTPRWRAGGQTSRRGGMLDTKNSYTELLLAEDDGLDEILANSQVALSNSDAHGAALRPTLISAELEKPWVVYDAAELFTDQGHTGMIR